MKKSLKSIVAILLLVCLATGMLAGCGSMTAQGSASSAALQAEEAYELAISAEEEEPEPLYSVVSPLGENEVQKIEMAPRLDTLAGKKIALVGGSFHASTTHAELKRQILEDYPDAQIYMFDEVGSAGTYNLFSVSNQVKTFQNKLQKLGIDAVITGNCG